MTSETLARAGTRGRLVAQGARAAEGRGMTGHDGVWVSHGADINPAPALHTEEEPQYSNDLRWVIRRQAR